MVLDAVNSTKIDNRAKQRAEKDQAYTCMLILMYTLREKIHGPEWPHKC